ncbi:hypothetical protein CMK11_20335 [Candidatus Poribacteria bacterium]|nr:hypothetical protein [Candidatus Poribacteria bacterium]
MRVGDTRAMSRSEDAPAVTMVVAMSADGKITTRDDAGPRFTGPSDKALLRRLRGESDAVVVGAATIINDDPAYPLPAETRRRRLDAGRWETPIRAVVSGRATVPPTARMFHGHESPALTFVGRDADPARVRALAEVSELHRGDHATRVSPAQIVDTLATTHGARKILLEGGGELNSAFLDAGLIHEAYVTISPWLIGGRGVASPIGGDGLNFSDIVPLELRALRVEEGETYLHYRVSLR